MSFRQITQIERWRNYCREHQEILRRMPRLAALFHLPTRFDAFLREGVFRDKHEELTIASLTSDECAAFEEFVDSYRNEWETYFASSIYRAYFDEADQRFKRKAP